MSTDKISFEPKVLEGEINIPYKWTTGPAAGKFLTTLRDERKIIGLKCSSCGRVSVPPEEICGKCRKRNSEFVDISDEGELVSFTEVRVPVFWQPAEPPFVIGFIKLDGADTLLIHRILASASSLKKGLRVKARWKEEREGHILDIEGFEIIQEG